MKDLSKFHPSVAAVLKWFETAHLPEHLQPVVDMLAEVAFAVAETTAPSAELTLGLRALLTAKDHLVRAAIETHDQVQQASAGDTHPTPEGAEK